MDKKITTPYESVYIDANDSLELPDKTAISGRLEQFLYALCSLDYENLPMPMSRIEMFANALITNEVPDIEPKSRSEQFFLAILTGNTDNLPEAKSRSEVLLRKIATNEYDLSDVEPIQSRYELLLAYLIQNNTLNISNLVGDIEYVMYSFSDNEAIKTLTNTAEFPIKDVVLEGQTLVNINKTVLNNGKINPQYYPASTLDMTMLKTETKYLIVVYNDGDSDTEFYLNGNSFKWNAFTVKSKNTYKTIGTTETEILDGIWLSNAIQQTTEQNIRVMLIEYQDGMENWNIPYFEGMQSVKMPVLTTTGKNLFNVTYNDGWLDSTTGEFVSSPGGTRKVTDFIDVTGGETYTISGCTMTGLRWYSINKKPMDTNWNYLTTTITAPTNAKYLRFTINSEVDYDNVQIEKGSIATSYESFKSNILTVNEDVTLRGIGGVRDELNLITGELIQRISTFKPTNAWSVKNELENTVLFSIKPPQDIDFINSSIISDKLPSVSPDTGSIWDKDIEGIGNVTRGDLIRVRLLKTKASNLREFENYLQSNPITIQYRLATESVKTVDLTMVNQDGEIINEINTFDDVTHFCVKSENLLSPIKMNVARYLFYKNFVISDGWKTIQNTMNYPIKNAVLKGQTLVNSRGNTVSSDAWSTTDSIEYIVERTNAFLNFECTLLPNTKYLIFFEFEGRGANVQFGTRPANGSWDSAHMVTTDGICKKVVTTGSDSKWLSFIVPNESLVTDYVKISRIMIIPYQDGMENWDIPYFEGMQSVKMPILKTTGKNLFDGTNLQRYWDAPFTNGNNFIAPSGNTKKYYSTGRIKVRKGKTYSVSGKNIIRGIISYFKTDDIKEYPFDGSKANQMYFTSPYDGYIEWYLSNDNVNNPVTDVQIEEGSVATEYEPYKSNVLTVNEEVELRRIGEAQDELNLLTGELIQRIGEITLNGSEKWEIREFNTTNTECVIFTINIDDKINNWLYSCDKFRYNNVDVILANNVEGIHTGGKPHSFFINVLKTKASTVEEFKNWLSNNNVTVQYQSIESVKTVDLHVINQDGETLKEVKTFDNITNINVSSSNGIPYESEMRIAKYPYYMNYSLDNSFDTIYNTMEYPVKSAILKGNTLVNLVNQENQIYSLTADGSYKMINIPLRYDITDTTKKLFLSYRVVTNTIESQYNNLGLFATDGNNNCGLNSKIVGGKIGQQLLIQQLSKSANHLRIYINNNILSGTLTITDIMLIEYQDGMENWDIPYFEGMQSVKMPVLKTTGKNLVSDLNYISPENALNLTKGNIRVKKGTTYSFTMNNLVSSTGLCRLGIMAFKNGENITKSDTITFTKGSLDFRDDVYVRYQTVGDISGLTNLIFTVNDDVELYVALVKGTKTDVNSSAIAQLEVGSISTSYEPFKSNTLTVNEPVELRGIDDIKDELNLLTGELTQRIGEVVLDGSDDERWSITGEGDVVNGYSVWSIISDRSMSGFSVGACDKLSVFTDLSKFTQQGVLLEGGTSTIIININGATSTDEVKQWLSQNPITVQYQLATESIKTVDLHSINQDGDVTSRLHTFNNITHIENSSLGLPSQVDLQVVSLNQDDIENMESAILTINRNHSTQNELIENANVQSDDIDYTMMATTEIYENIL